MDLYEIVRAEGFEIMKHGRLFKILCPFHPDRNPSLVLYQDSQRFFCFACGARGDGIAFVKKLRGLSFREALNYLGLKKEGWSYKGQRRCDNKWIKKKILVRLFERDVEKYYSFLTDIFRAFEKLRRGFKTIEESKVFAELYHELPKMEWKLEILRSKDDETKLMLLKEDKLWQMMSLIWKMN
jgi:hypothetical protein